MVQGVGTCKGYAGPLSAAHFYAARQSPHDEHQIPSSKRPQNTATLPCQLASPVTFSKCLGTIDKPAVNVP